MASCHLLRPQNPPQKLVTRGGTWGYCGGSGILIAGLVPEREKPKEKGQGQSELVEVSSRPDQYVQFM